LWLDKLILLWTKYNVRISEEKTEKLKTEKLKKKRAARRGKRDLNSEIRVNKRIILSIINGKDKFE